MNKTERSLRLLVQLYRTRSFTTREAAELCGVSLRRARSDLKGLARVAPLQLVRDGQRSRWVLAPERSLGPLDRISLLVGREVTRFLEGTSLHRGIDRLQGLHAADETIPARVRYLSEPARPYGPSDEIVDAWLLYWMSPRTLARLVNE